MQLSVARGHLGQQVDQQPVVGGCAGDVGMRVVGTPQHAFRGVGHQPRGEPHRVRVRRPGARQPVHPAGLHPHLAGVEQAEQSRDRGAVRPGGQVQPGQVVDDHRDREPPDQVGVPGDIGAVQVDLGVPAQVRDQPDGAPDRGRGRRGSQVREEVQPEAAHPGVVQPLDLGPRGGGPDQRHTAVPAGPGGQRVEQRAMIGAVARGLDDDGALEAEVPVQRGQLPGRHVWRGERAARGVREPGRRAEHVAVRVTAALGQPQRRGARGRVRRRAGQRGPGLSRTGW